MANWTRLRAALHDLETAVEQGDIAAQLVALGPVAAQTGALLNEPVKRADGRRDSGDVLGGDAYRSCDVLLDKLGTDTHSIGPQGIPWDGSAVRTLLVFLKELLKR